LLRDSFPRAIACFFFFRVPKPLSLLLSLARENFFRTLWNFSREVILLNGLRPQMEKGDGLWVLSAWALFNGKGFLCFEC
jgi:hypothetical protein